MATTLSQIRFMIEREIKEPIENEDVVQWANQVNADIGTSINLPATAPIVINTTAIEYPEPANLKVINRMWLQSDFNAGIDREYTGRYRRYNGKIIFPHTFWQTDTLNVDFYKQMTNFTAITQSIDLDDRYAPLYVSYGLMKYYKLPAVMARMGDSQARKESETAQGMYLGVKQQLVSLYSLDSEPTVIRERW
jgi:hypothetical protein